MKNQDIVLLKRSQRQDDSSGDDDRPRLTAARAAAEALFRPQRSSTVPETPSSDGPVVRIPRVLAARVPAVVGQEEHAAPAGSPPPITLDIPPAQVARIRTWIEYGMTVRQVAKVLGVPVGLVQDLLRSA